MPILPRRRNLQTGNSAMDALLDSNAAQALRMNDNLGYETPGQAMSGILNDAQWQKRWQVDDPAMARIIERDRKRIRLEADAPEQVLDPSNNSEPF
jgi:hypothetical protein